MRAMIGQMNISENGEKDNNISVVQALNKAHSVLQCRLNFNRK